MSQDKQTKNNLPALHVRPLYVPPGVNDPVVVSAAALKSIIDRDKEQHEDIQVLYNSALDVLDILGVLDRNTNQVKESIRKKEESPFPSLLKSATHLISLLGQANMMGRVKRNAQEELERKFSFFEKLMPLMMKYNQVYYKKPEQKATIIPLKPKTKIFLKK